MKEIIEALYPMNRNLVSKGFDDALDWIDKLIGLKITSIPSGTKLGSWTVPDEWMIRDGWLKKDGEKILNYKTDPLAIASYSKPVKRKISFKQLDRHVTTNKEMPDATPYNFLFYVDEWGLCMPYNKRKELKRGEYEVFIDSEFKKGEMKYGVHTIPGKSDREILLFAHLDHPHQANDNLSGVACLIGMVKKFKCEHTIKLVFCAETIGSLAYAHKEDLSKVDAMIAVDMCGNEKETLLQFAWDFDCNFNRAAKCAVQAQGKPFRLGKFRNVIGSDEYAFNDPQLGIPGIMFSTYPYPEYHTSADTPDKINYDKIQEIQEIILKTIEISEKDFIPKRECVGQLMRSAYNVQAPMKESNMVQDYFWYSIDGKRSVSNLCSEFDLPYNSVYDLLTKVEKDGFISRVDTGEVGQ